MSRTCPECGRSHSEFDPRCPSCGTPLPTTIGGPPPAAAAAPLAAGSRLGRFEILAELGRGGMGVVYRARDTQLGREVALKLLAGGADHQRLLREARAVAALDHPAIGTLYEVGAAPGVSFLVLALYQGGTLQAELAERGALPLAEAAEMLRQLAGALAAAHAAGICHRDVKPSNVFRLADGRLKLIDFGIARHGGSAAASGGQRPVGTAAYMAPERLRGEDPGPPADIWSLAVLGWEISTGGHPFDLARPGWLARVQAARLAPAGGEPPPALAAIFAPCLALDPAARPAAAALEQKFSGLAGLAADPVRREKTPPAFRGAAVALAVAGAVAFAATLSVFLLRTPEKPRVVVLLPPRVEGGMAAGDRQRLAPISTLRPGGCCSAWTASRRSTARWRAKAAASRRRRRGRPPPMKRSAGKRTVPGSTCAAHGCCGATPPAKCWAASRSSCRRPPTRSPPAPPPPRCGGSTRGCGRKTALRSPSRAPTITSATSSCAPRSTAAR